MLSNNIEFIEALGTHTILSEAFKKWNPRTQLEYQYSGVLVLYYTRWLVSWPWLVDPDVFTTGGRILSECLS